MPVGFFSEVNLYTGRVLTTLPVVGWSGRGPSVGFALYHNAACGEGPAHSDWTHSYSTHLELGSGEITVVSPDGTRDVFTGRVAQVYSPWGIDCFASGSLL